MAAAPMAQPPMRDLEVISDPEAAKAILEPTRAAILFHHLVHGPMTVKQLADALNKNPGTILHHIEKLRGTGLVVEERTEVTPTGIIQRYYRATAREYRLALGMMAQSDNGVAKFARDRLTAMINALVVYGIKIPAAQLTQGLALLGAVVDRENTVISQIPISDTAAYYAAPAPVQADVSRLIRRFALDSDPEYTRLKTAWHTFLRGFQTPAAQTGGKQV